LYAVNGFVPAEELAKALEDIRLNPLHPGAILRDLCLGDAVPVPEAARMLGIGLDSLELVLSCRAPISPDLAASLERLGWSTARLWSALQARYDQAQRPAGAPADGPRGGREGRACGTGPPMPAAP